MKNTKAESQNATLTTLSRRHSATSTLRCVDLFCGCGGMSLGFEKAGFDVKAGFEFWEPAMRVYEANFKHPVLKQDLSNVDEAVAKMMQFKPELIVGGPPCQDFSIAGHKDESLGRAILSVCFSRIVAKVLPKFFVMENVDNIRKSETFKKVLSNFRAAGYGLTIRVLDAAYCGVPQTRKRMFVIGGIKENDGFLDKEIDEAVAKKPMSIHDYLGDSLGIKNYFRIPTTYSRRAVFSIDEPSATIRGVDRPIPKGYKGHPNDSAPVSESRILTPKERSYIQTFPKEFIFEGSKTDLNMMIGNAVPVNMAEFVGNALMRYLKAKVRNGVKQIRAVDLFSGCGGMSLGLEQAGFDVVGAFDNWEPALTIYKENFKHPIFNEDLSREDIDDKVAQLKPDLIAGGPPCQDYSIAGPRNLGKRANLTIRFAQIVASVKPQWVIFENVYNIERFRTLPEMKKILSDAGFGLSSMVLDASHCGAPQKRRRFILVGRLGASDGFLDEILKGEQSKKPMTVRDYLGDSLHTQFYYMHPRSYKRRAVFSIDEPSSTIRGSNRPIPKNYKKHPADKAEIGDGVRALTSHERALLQTFPPDFSFPGSKTDIELAIGNAIPPALACFVANCINKWLKNEDRR